MDTKKRTLISYEKLTPEQRKALNRSFPDGYTSKMTELKMPSGEEFRTLVWETDEMVYLVKFHKTKALTIDDDDDDDDDDLDEIDNESGDDEDDDDED